MRRMLLFINKCYHHRFHHYAQGHVETQTNSGGSF